MAKRRIHCYNEQCAGAPHLVRTVWNLVGRDMVDGPPLVCANHDEALLMLVKLTAYGYRLDDINRRWAKRMNRHGGSCYDATATPQLGTPDDRFRVACMRKSTGGLQVSRRGEWTSVAVPGDVDRQVRRDLGIPEG